MKRVIEDQHRGFETDPVFAAVEPAFLRIPSEFHDVRNGESVYTVRLCSVPPQVRNTGRSIRRIYTGCLFSYMPLPRCRHARFAREADECVRPTYASALQEVPGFFVAVVFGAGVWGEEDVGLAVGGADGEDVPRVRRDDEGGDDVDVARGVGDSVGVEVAFVGVAAVEDGAFDLDPEEASAMVGGDVVGRAVSPGLGDTESELDGPGDEAKFGPFSALLGVADGHAG